MTSPSRTATTARTSPWAAITVISLIKNGYGPSLTPPMALAFGAAAFCLLALLNCGGYRYGIGDQAFYVPAVVQHLDPSLFPRDRMLLHVQDQFMMFDE